MTTELARLLEGRTILAVDDDEFMCALYEAIFRAAGAGVVTDQAPVHALELALTVHPDLVILDVEMPEINGWRLALQLRRNPETAEIPLLFVTSAPDAESCAARLGASALGKPFEPTALLERVEYVLEPPHAACSGF